MLCDVCVWLLRGRRGHNPGGTLGLQFVHHDSAESFWASVARDCSICRPLGDEVGAKFIAALQTVASAHDDRAFLDLHSRAYLSVTHSGSDCQIPIYRLDFVVEWAASKFRHTFVLRPIASGAGNVELPLRTPVSTHMYHAEVLGLAKTWLQRCTCVAERVLKKEDYPTRLISLAKLKELQTIDTKNWKYREHGGEGDTTVNLVDTKYLDWTELKHKQYVTLSHKWGGMVEPVRLTKGTEKAFRGGVRLRHLSRTFQDAIQFALGLDDSVHYIWIDSLCIIQGDEKDWRRESDRMQDVYRNSFLNISATAAEHSGEGLFSQRDPQHLWDEVIQLDVDGLDSGAEFVREDHHEKTTAMHRGKSNNPATADPGVSLEYLQLTKVQSCLLVDVNWESLVNKAPLHKRGWVVQERLLAPRVLHFCRGRIAWECAEFDDIEGHGPNMPNYRLIGEKIYESIPMKGLPPGKHGKRLRDDRLRGVVDLTDLDENDLKPSIIHSLEQWSRTVEMYCKTDLTKAGDRLIAFSGIAHRMAEIIEHRMAGIIAESGKGQDKIRYIGGLWSVHLISQLLWRVEPVYHGDSDFRADSIEYLSRRPTPYRAPTFSWASVDSQFGNGITCGRFLDSGCILVKVPQDDNIPTDRDMDDSELKVEREVWKTSVWVQTKTANKFGLVTSAHIRLWAWVHRVKLQREGTHYYWSLFVSDHLTTEPDKRKQNQKKNFNVYLDCPSDDDKGNRLIESDEIYCSPIAYGSVSSSTDLVCLLLIKAPEDEHIQHWPVEYRQWTFKRIGYTKLSVTFDHFTWNYISDFRPGQKGSDDFYDRTTGRNLVCII